jgi:RHS repeat-associated protein
MVWVPSDNGQILAIVGVTGGLADVDTDGDGVADDALGLGVEERERLAALYPVGQILWRVPITHFSAWDINWGFGPPPDATPPDAPPPDGDTPPNDPACVRGSIILCESQTLGESIPVTGTPFTLEYRSNRVLGRAAANTLSITLTGDTLPLSLKAIELDIRIVGTGRRFFERLEPPTENQTYTFNQWDGLDWAGRPVQGRQRAVVRIGYVYDGVYERVARFGYNGNGLVITGSLTRREVVLWQVLSGEVGLWNAKGQDLGGWSLSPHHAYDPISGALYLGTGERRSAQDVNHAIATFAGTGQPGSSGEGTPATQAQLNFPAGVAVAPDGTVLIADTSNHLIRAVAPDGTITRIAGTGVGCSTPTAACGDGGPPLTAQLNLPTQVALAPDGTLYIADTGTNRVRMIRDGIITTLAGTGATCVGTGTCGNDGGPATAAILWGPAGVAVAPDGSVYIADSQRNRVRRVAPDGIITTVAGTGEFGTGNDDVPGPSARLNLPIGLAVRSDGSLYIADALNSRIRRLGPDGIIHTIAGAASGMDADGIPAINAQLSVPNGLAIGADGTLYIADTGYHRVRSVAPDGIIRAVACSGMGGFSGENGAAAAAKCNQVRGVAEASDRTILVADTGNHRVRRVVRPFPGLQATDVVIPAASGEELYVFDRTGRHLRTLEALTGAVRLQFSYDAAGRLSSVQDANGNLTTIERDLDGNPLAIQAPGGQRTTLTAYLENGFLATIANPAEETTQFTYTSGGLLTFLTDPRSHTYAFTYDPAGRLITDNDPAGGSKTLARSSTASGYAVSVTTGLGRASDYAVQQVADGSTTRTRTDPAGLITTTAIGLDGTRTTTTPDGTVTVETPGPDPRFGFQAPFPASLTIRTPPTAQTPSGLTYTRTETREVPPNLPDPLVLTALTDTVVVNGATYTRAFDGPTRTITDTTPMGRSRVTTLDTQGRTSTVQVTGFEPVAFGYDAQGRVHTITQGTGMAARTYTVTYDAGNRPTTFTDPLSQTVDFAYDAVDRVTTLTRNDGGDILFGRGPAGHLTSLTPPGRAAHLFAYSPVDLLASYTPPDIGIGTTATTYAYNPDRQLTLVTRPDTLTTALDYESTGRLSAVTVPQGQVTYGYDAATGQLDTITTPDGVALTLAYDGPLLASQTWAGPVAGSVSRGYDANFRPASIAVNGGSALTFQYDADGLLTQAGSLVLTRDPVTGLLTDTALGQVADTRTYNTFGDVTGYTATVNGTPVWSLSSTPDALGRVSQKVETIGGQTTTYGYSYDAVGRLQDVLQDGVNVAHYDYDANGNRLSRVTATGTETGSYDGQDRLTTYGAAAYTYTATGELATKTVGGLTTTYTYDVLGNLRTVQLPDATLVEYVVDGQNRRIGKQVNGALVQGFLYEDQLRPSAELDGAGTVVAQFVYGTRVNVPDYMVTSGGTYRFVTDHLGSPRLVVNTSDGTVVQRIDYDEFGRVTLDTSPGFQPFGFAGGLYDRDTGLVRFGARDYDATTGRWTAKDPIKFDGGDPNLYGYTLDDPVNLSDPTGEVLPPAVVYWTAILLLGTYTAATLEPLLVPGDPRLPRGSPPGTLRPGLPGPPFPPLPPPRPPAPICGP